MKHKEQTICMLTILIISFFSFASMLGTAQAQSYPKKPVEIICPHAPGAGTDAAGRIIATYLSDKWGVPVNVVNKAGGMAIPGTLDALKSAPDGYTMLNDGHSTNTMQAAVMKDLPPEFAARTPVAKVIMVPSFYIVRADSPWKTLAEAMDHARKNPAAFKYGAGILSSINNFCLTRLFEVAKIDPNAGRVTFDKGHTPSLQALLGGHVQFGVGFIGDLKSLYPSKIRALAVTSPERIKAFPDIPTTKEVGFPGANIVGWYGISGPPKLPEDIINIWVKTLADAQSDPKFLELAEKVGHLPRFMGHKEMVADLKEEYKLYLEIAERTGLRK